MKKSKIKWTKEKCVEEALKYKTKMEFKIKCKGAYCSSCNNGWLNEICSHMSIIRINWTKEKCAKEALKYNSINEYQKHSKASYLASYRHNWMGDVCKHMTRPINNNKIWFKENCKIEAQKYLSKSDFSIKSRGAYKVALKNGWLNEICSHMISKKSSNNYWIKDNILVEALKYKTRKEFKEKSHKAYVGASKLNILNDVCEHMEITGNVLSRCIYAFEFSDNYVYVGLTCNDDRRKREHLNDIKSPVYKHMKENNISPKHILLSNGYVDVEVAQELEKSWYLNYKNNGWFMLNSNRLGGTGGIILPKNRMH